MQEELVRTGVVVVPGVYTEEQLLAFRAQHAENFQEVLGAVGAAEPERRCYTHTFKGVVSAHYVDCWDMADGSETLQIGSGRYDYTYGMDSGCFADASFHEPPVVAELMRLCLGGDYTHYAGCLTSSSRSGNGFWHRDTLPLFGDGTVDVQMPPYYYTVLVPLVPLTAENGATEVILGSHRVADAEISCDRAERFRATCPPGSVVVFDGRCCHRGMPNLTADERTVLYTVWHKIWYNDIGTLDFEFPKGSWRAAGLGGPEPVEARGHYGREGHGPSHLQSRGRQPRDQLEAGFSKEVSLHPGVELRLAPAHGYGLFATQPISKGEVVWSDTRCSASSDSLVKIADLLDMDPEDAERVVHFAFQVSETEMSYTEVGPMEGRDPSDFTNHSCDPSTVFADDVSVMVALRDLAPGEEITYDYATSETMAWPWEEDGWECRCGSRFCRGRVRADDWRRPELAARYGRVAFAPYIQRMLEREGARG